MSGTEQTPLLDVRDLSAGYGKVTIVEGLSFSVNRGDRLAIIGRNGVGKTTTLRAILGLTSWARGTLLFEGEDLSSEPTHRRAQRGLGYVPQTRDIFPSLTVEENLLAGLKQRPRASLDEAYALFPRLAERRRNGGTQLSGGEQQMLSVARALLGKPRLLLLDEPLEGLSPLIRQELLQSFGLMSSELGVTVVMVEQQVKEALEYADQALVMDRGTAVHRGPAAALLADEAALERWIGVAV